MLALLMARNELSTSCSTCERTRYGMVWQGFRHSPALASSPGGGGAGAGMTSASTTFCIAKARHAPFCLTQTSRKKLLLALLLPLLLAWADIRWPVTAATRP